MLWLAVTWTKTTATPLNIRLTLVQPWGLRYLKNLSRMFMHSEAWRRAELITSALWPQSCAAWKLKRWRVEARERNIICSFQARSTSLRCSPDLPHLQIPSSGSPALRTLAFSFLVIICILISSQCPAQNTESTGSHIWLSVVCRGLITWVWNIITLIRVDRKQETGRNNTCTSFSLLSVVPLQLTS